MILRLFISVASVIAVGLVSTKVSSETPDVIPGFFTPSCEISTTNPSLSMIVFPPIYPEKAVKNRSEGWVVVRFDVTDNGVTENFRIVESEPGEIFDRAVIDAVKKWVVYRECLDGTFVGTKDAEERIEFRLE